MRSHSLSPRRPPHDVANRLNDESGFIPLNVMATLPSDYELCVRHGLCELVFGFAPGALQNVAEFRWGRGRQLHEEAPNEDRDRHVSCWGALLRFDHLIDARVKINSL
jgi:hypothetical protein